MKLMGIIDRQFIKRPLLRRLVTKLFYGDKDQNIELFTTSFYINTIKENGYLRASKYALKSSVYKDEAAGLISLASFITPGTSFIDAGANVGLFSCVFQKFQHVYNDFKIYAFEANPDTFKRLLKTTEDKNIEVFNVALSDTDKELEFVEGVVSHVFAEKTHSNSYHLKNQKTVKIQAKRLDSFDIAGNTIILKIDVEGYEYEVLEGARNFFESKRVKAVYLDGFNKKAQIIPFLENYGFDLFEGKTLQPNPVNNFSLLALKKQ
ncbi:MAG TPA: FkbM family methyltransferase [Chitinophagaceae bacterium]|nr:FkbM family methyltransferase [Chitinophagaceae bacterium]